MITEKTAIKCEAIFSEDKAHRLWWKQVWDKSLPLACVIMINPCIADTVLADTTTYLVVNNIARLEIIICNKTDIYVQFETMIPIDICKNL